MLRVRKELATMATTAPTHDREWLKVKRVAHDLDYSTKTVYGWIRSGQLRATRVGTELRIHVNDLDAFIQGQSA
jgi:excisionase family DNA binding protein